MVDRTKPGNRGTYVAILAICAAAIVGVLMFTGGERETVPAAPAPASSP
jgi:hypothetical protein